jgi:replicative DNA helicase
MRGVQGGAAQNPESRVPPHDLEAERAVIGAMLVSENAVSTVGERISAEDFYSETHRVIYRAMMTLYGRGEPIDQLTLTNELKGMDEYDRVGGRAYVFQIVESVPTAANASRYAEIVRGKALLRSVIDAGSRITEDAYNEPDDVGSALDSAEQLIYGISNRTMKEQLSPLSELAPSALEMIQNLYEHDGKVTGVETGFEDLDRLTTGFHKSDLVVLAARPAMGKCVKWDNLVVDPASGERRTIQDCVQRRMDEVSNVSERGSVQTTTVSDWIDSGVKPCFRVTTRTGRSVEVTGHHPFLTVEGWTPLHRLSEGDSVAVPRSLPVFGGDESWPLEQVKLLAYFIAEGGLTRECPKWTNADPELAQDFSDALASRFPDAKMRPDGEKSIDYKVVGDGSRRGSGANPVTVWLREIGLMGKYGEEKCVPDTVWGWSRRYLAEFLRTLFSCDATIYRLGGYPRIEFSVSSEDLARDVHHALTRFGIVSKLWLKKERCWRVEITAPDSVLRYQAEIGWLGEKAARFAGETRDLPQRGSNYGHPSREVWKLVREAAERRGMSLAELGRRSGETDKRGKYAGYNPHTNRRLPAYRLARYAEVLEDEELARLASPDLLWDEIVSIEYVGEHQVYDLTVPDGSNFVAQDMFVHNTAFALNAIWQAAGVDGLPVAIFSLEMSKEQLVQRLISQYTRIPTQALRSGDVKAEDWPKLVRGVSEVSKAPIWIDDTAGTSLMEMRAKVRRLASRLNSQSEDGDPANKPLSLVVVDYLQLMVGRTNESRQQEIAEISRGLKVLARDLNVPVIAVAQLSRAVEQRHDKRPLLSDLRDCLPGGGLIADADTGLRFRVDEIVRAGLRPNVWSMGDDLKLHKRPVSDAWETGEKVVYRLRTRQGRILRATGGHRLLCEAGWGKLEDLRVGDSVAVPREFPKPAEVESVGVERAELLGWLIGDGWLGGTAALTVATKEEAETAAELGRREFGLKPQIKPEREGTTALKVIFTTGRMSGAGKNALTSWLRSIGAWGYTGRDKHVPACVFGWDADCIAGFLRGLFHADGSFTARNTTAYVRLSTISERLARDVHELLLRLGILSVLRTVDRTSSGYRTDNTSGWVVYMGERAEIGEFMRRVGFLGAKHEKAAARFTSEKLNDAGSHDRLPPSVNERISELRLTNSLSHSDVGWREQGTKMSRNTGAMVAERLDLEWLRRLADSDLCWDEVVAVEECGKEMTYDLTVDDLHNFCVDGFLTHNSGAIEQDADMVMFLYRDEYYNPDSEDKGIAEVIVGKHRNGPTGKAQLAWLEQYTKFGSLARGS